MQKGHVRQIIVPQTSALLASEKSSVIFVGDEAPRNGQPDGSMK